MPTREEHSEEVSEWEHGECRDCGLSFPKRFHYESRCPLCFKLDKDYKVLWGDQAFLWAQEKAARLEDELRVAKRELEEAQSAKRDRKAPSLPEELLRDMILLCHPDKHRNSEKATKVTRYLLALRKKKPRKRRTP